MTTNARIMKYIKNSTAFLIGGFLSLSSYGAPTGTLGKDNHPNMVSHRLQFEEVQDSNPFSITAYQPNYVLPVNYTSSLSPIYKGITPNNQKIQNVDLKFQFSFKAPVWRNFFGRNNALYIAYTQQSFWQAYNDSPFFRANNYQPEIFLENNINLPLWVGWRLHLLNVGAMHQSNGRGGLLERSWNRVYLEASLSKGRWLVSIKPWYILQQTSFKTQNPDIEHYLGHGRLLIAYKFKRQVVSLETYNNVESGFCRSSVQANYSFPLIKKVRGFAQFFSGYGQSLLEYNHRTTSVGLGISLSDWL